ncbi:glycosyltransferase [Ornithinimicrobium sp. INDO-MA30-4]|uniref:glycosyltransferase family 2 protein n=1 Tax=Ornithinimicrobium sp. INDO-MA30-4 TaxID=2908651 RepID=UPI001F2E4E5A|nr:glycosyltransferase [Ornithinimicrobium sp. INDO-MA30-4]UJH69907.1 glycosyltransferase [Ornithinimicrobium sp. INDO-MA30-4]
MAVYNGEPFVAEAIQRVLDQSFGHFELVIVDDGSTDEAPRTLMSFADSRIRVITLESNVGRTLAFDRGLKEAKGEYVGFIGADDVVLPNWLAALLGVLDADPKLDLVSCFMERVTVEGRRTGELVVGPEKHEDVVAGLLLGPNISHGGAIGRAAVLVPAGFTSPRWVAEDYYLWAQLLLAGSRFSNVSEVFYLYRQHERQVTRSEKPAMYEAHREIQGILVDGLWPSATAEERAEIVEWLYWTFCVRQPSSVQDPMVMDRALRVTRYLIENRPDNVSEAVVQGWRQRTIDQDLIAWGGRVSIGPLLGAASEIPLRRLPRVLARSIGAFARANRPDSRA